MAKKKNIATEQSVWSPKLIRLGKTIRKLRRAKHYSKTNLGALARVNQDYIDRVERGEEDVVFVTLVRIARALGMSTAKLMRKARL